MVVEILSRIGGEKLNKWNGLISLAGLHSNVCPQRIVLVWDDNELVATGGRDGNILKLLAVSPLRQGEDLLSKVVTELRKDAFEEGHSHLFLYTKPANKYIFASLFFYPIVETDKVLFMENKREGIRSFLDSLPIVKNSTKTGMVVMNCNPFTSGHQYLIEKAASECDCFYVFVLSEESDGFSAKDRFEMVKRGTSHLSNVTVLQTGPYLISSATFPTYFLKDRDKADEVMCDIDIEIFMKYFVPKLGVNVRYVGTEPLSNMTNVYNETMRRKLSDSGVEFVEIERKEIDGTPISASAVRSYIRVGEIDKVERMVPKTTFEYLKENKLI